MKKTIATLILAFAAATPALASDGSEIAMHSHAQSGFVAMTNGTDTYAAARNVNWQRTQDAYTRHQEMAHQDLMAR